MNTNMLTALNTTPPVDKAHLKTAGAAKDFEALLVGQMLRSVREEGSGWQTAALAVCGDVLPVPIAGGRFIRRGRQTRQEGRYPVHHRSHEVDE